MGAGRHMQRMWIHVAKIVDIGMRWPGFQIHISLLRKVGEQGDLKRRSSISCLSTLGVIGSVVASAAPIENADTIIIVLQICSARVQPSLLLPRRHADENWSECCVCVCARRFIGVIGAFYYLVSFNVNLWRLRAAGFLFARQPNGCFKERPLLRPACSARAAIRQSNELDDDDEPCAQRRITPHTRPPFDPTQTGRVFAGIEIGHV